MLHPLEVASLLYCIGAPDHLIAAGVLHDALEKTSAREENLRRKFGLQTARLVVDVTDDDRITSYAKRKAALRDSPIVGEIRSELRAVTREHRVLASPRRTSAF